MLHNWLFNKYINHHGGSVMRKFNIEEFVKFIIFIAFNALLCYLMKTGKINNFINPKMFIYIRLP